jgi:hypothetical protein
MKLWPHNQLNTMEVRLPVPMDVIDALALFPVGLTHNLSRHLRQPIRDRAEVRNVP